MFKNAFSPKFLFLFFFLISLLFFTTQSIFAQTKVSEYSCPDYLFSTDLKKGNIHEDVHVMQEILNLDKRTVVAYTGPGSIGHETGFFGVATREALKRFQALFIEYIGIANGKFGPRTRTSMNAVCKGPFFTGGKGGVYDIGTSSTTLKDIVPPIIAVAAPATTTLDLPFRAFIGASEAIQFPSLAGLIIENATAGDVRKTSSTTYSFLVTPNQDAAGLITLQFEADSVKDLSNNKNDIASNEWNVYIIPTELVVASDTLDLSLINLPTVTPTDCSTVTSVDISDYSNPCFGKVPVTQNQTPNSDGGGGGGGKPPPPIEQIMKMLEGLLKSLAGGGGGGKDGGESGGQSVCACTGHPTIRLSGKKGSINGQADMFMNPGGGSWVDNGILPPPPVCGLKIGKKGCEHPELDASGNLMKYTVPTSPTHIWNGGG